MARKIRSDIKVGTLEKKLGVAPGTITNPDGSDARSDKKLGTLRKEFAKANESKATSKKKANVPTANPKVKLSSDQKSAAKRTIKSNPKTPASLMKKARAAVKKSKK